MASPRQPGSQDEAPESFRVSIKDFKQSSARVSEYVPARQAGSEDRSDDDDVAVSLRVGHPNHVPRSALAPPHGPTGRQQEEEEEAGEREGR